MKKVLCLLAIGLMTAGMASAQTGSVAGLVIDGESMPVEGARVSLHAETSCVAYVFTGPDGQYLFEDVPVGIYTVKAGMPHVGNATIEGIEVLDGQTTQVPDLMLECGGGGGNGPYMNKHQHKHSQQNGGGGQ
jgi:hypothetical protein